MPLNIKAKGGFVSTRTPFVADLFEYHSLELRIKNNSEKVFYYRMMSPVCSYDVTDIIFIVLHSPFASHLI